MRRMSKANFLARTIFGKWQMPGRYVAANVLGSLLARRWPVRTSEIHGYSLELDLRDEVQRQIYFGIFDPHIERVLTTHLQPGSVFYDVGANVGYFSFVASSVVGGSGEVHSFEPIGANADRILTNVDRNGIRNLTLNRAAVADSNGRVTLYTSDEPTNSGWASVVPTERRRETIEAEVLTIDRYVFEEGHRPPSLMKIDIEGAEPRALAGMRRLLASEIAPDLIIEINPFLLERANSTASSILETLRAAGYHLRGIQHEIPADPELIKIGGLVDVFASRAPDLQALPTR